MKRGSARGTRAAVAALAAIAMAPRAARAAEVVIPIHVDHELIQEVLTREVFDGPDASATVWKDGAGCSYMTLASPKVGSLGVRLHLVANGEAKVGKKIGASCVTVLEWKGTIDVTEEVRVDPDQPLVHFRVADASLHGTSAGSSGTETLERWLKLYVRPRLETVSVDLRPTLAELQALIPTVLPHGDPRVTEQIVSSFRVIGAEADPAGLVTKLRLELPDRPEATARTASAAAPRTAIGANPDGEPGTDGDATDGGGVPAEPALTGEELARWDAAWQRWDAFITFVAKHVASDAQSRELRDALLGVLIDARQDVAEILVPSQPDGPDPLRSLFVNTWARLVPVLRSVSASMPGAEALRYASFVSAGDALTAIDALGPQVGLDVSADGLRRMARMLTPQLAEDPLVYGEQVDPELRRIFGFGTPLLLPGEKPAAEPVSPRPSPAESVPEEPRTEPEPELVDLDRLARWAPTRAELDEYLPLVRTLLLRAADQSATRYEVPAALQSSFRTLVLTTAWQESCWRQWTTGRDGVLRPMRSRAGAVGVMQVLERAWRGFYDLRTLRNDFDYNARAGVEILARYLTEHAIDDPRDAIANPELLARTTYALYHAGPKGGAGRIDNPRTPARIRKIDDQFWRRYQYVRDGEEFRVRNCF